MSECCSSNQAEKQTPKRYVCPENGKQYVEVPYGTVLHHVNKPWNLDIKDQRYYFCDDPNCDVVYFGLDNVTIKKSMLRTRVGIKDSADDLPVCYCFGVTKADAKLNKQTKEFVVEQTKNARCSCETSNPSGRCCLKDFPK